MGVESKNWRFHVDDSTYYSITFIANFFKKSADLVKYWNMTTRGKFMESTNKKNYTLYIWMFHFYSDVKNELSQNYRDFDHIPKIIFRFFSNF